MILNYEKMHGSQNTMTMINNMSGEIELTNEQVAYICKTLKTDGLILMEPSDKADCYMRYYNGDGSFGEMCGNGIRCLADFYRREIQDKPQINIDSPVGIKKITHSKNLYTVNMGQPKDLGKCEVQGMHMQKISMGNPHTVTFVDNVDEFDLETIGPKVEVDPEYPEKTNFEIVEKISDNHFKMRVWERGAGLTLSCGTGACATYVTAKKAGLTNGKTQIDLPGGPLWIDETEDGEILMTGPAETIEKSSITIKN